MFFANWVIEYHFPVKLIATFVFFCGLMMFTPGFGGKQKIGALTVAGSTLIWCGMDILTDIVNFNGFANVESDIIRQVQAFGGVWAVVIAIAIIGARIAVNRKADGATILIGVVLVGMMVWQVVNEMAITMDNQAGHDMAASFVSYAQQLVPACLWIQLSRSNKLT